MFFLEQPRLRVETLCPELAEGFLGLASAATAVLSTAVDDRISSELILSRCDSTSIPMASQIGLMGTKISQSLSTVTMSTLLILEITFCILE